ncbi:MAG TPA: DUF4177 domain-containing protein, partial [Acidimicrobiales bacterium]|nr:DUF4177 domain-containing protein [Acidimicrobiales bacterium]
MAKAFGYKVVELREGVIGGKMLGDKLEKVLNEHGRQGWQLKSVTAVEVKERLGPGWGRGGSRDIRTDDGLTASRRSGALGGAYSPDGSPSRSPPHRPSQLRSESFNSRGRLGGPHASARG